ncbi:hypothetical protein GCM10029964_082350 [Kibdelosporangium lantanae]
MYRDEDGNYYHVDRDPDGIAGDGFYTALSEERILAACADVLDCTVVIVPEDGRIVTDVLLELAPGASPDADRTEAVRTALGERVGGTLDRVVVVRQEDIPLTVTGKVRKFLLRQQHLSKEPT